MGELDRAARQLERLLHDPLASAVRGTVELTSVPPPAPRGRYQEVRIDAVAEAPGMAPTAVVLTVVLPAKHWPAVGMRLSALVPPSEPQSLEVDWSPLTR